MSTILCVNALSSGEKFLEPPGYGLKSLHCNHRQGHILISLLNKPMFCYLCKKYSNVASRARWYTPCIFACWGVSPIPIEHTINCVATPPAEAKKSQDGLSLFL